MPILLAGGHDIMGYLYVDNNPHILSVTHRQEGRIRRVRAYVDGVLVRDFLKFAADDKITFAKFLWEQEKCTLSTKDLMTLLYSLTC